MSEPTPDRNGCGVPGVAGDFKTNLTALIEQAFYNGYVSGTRNGEEMWEGRNYRQHLAETKHHMLRQIGNAQEQERSEGRAESPGSAG